MIKRWLISLTGIRNMFVFMHAVSHIPNSLLDKQARAAHASWILYGKNLKEITLTSTKICYRSILANVLMNSRECMTAQTLNVIISNVLSSCFRRYECEQFRSNYCLPCIRISIKRFLRRRNNSRSSKKNRRSF